MSGCAVRLDMVVLSLTARPSPPSWPGLFAVSLLEMPPREGVQCSGPTWTMLGCCVVLGCCISCVVLRCRVVELTGDVSPDVRAIEQADVIVTTPEKWDGISRSWQNRTYVQVGGEGGEVEGRGTGGEGRGRDGKGGRERKRGWDERSWGLGVE